MTLTLQELSDRIEINDLLVRYTNAIDAKNWELLDTCFLPDAELDYVSSGGISGSYPEVRSWLSNVLELFAVTVHYVTNSEVELEGDVAHARTAVYNPMFFENPDGTVHHFAVGAYYDDDLIRTERGWRIARRREDHSFTEGNMPAVLAAAGKS